VPILEAFYTSLIKKSSFAKQKSLKIFFRLFNSDQVSFLRWNSNQSWSQQSPDFFLQRVFGQVPKRTKIFQPGSLSLKLLDLGSNPTIS